MSFKDKIKLNNEKTSKENQKDEKPFISSIDQEKDGKKSSLGMILFAIIIGFIVGAFIWFIFSLSIVLTNLIWETAFSISDFYWIPLLLCTFGGLVIGLYTYYFGDNLYGIEEIIETVQTKGEFTYDNLPLAIIAFFLPIIFAVRANVVNRFISFFFFSF